MFCQPGSCGTATRDSLFAAFQKRPEGWTSSRYWSVRYCRAKRKSNRCSEHGAEAESWIARGRKLALNKVPHLQSSSLGRGKNCDQIMRSSPCRDAC